MIDLTLKAEFGELTTEFFKEYPPGYEGAFFRDRLAFRDQRDGLQSPVDLR